jgi:hypothetical protein
MEFPMMGAENLLFGEKVKSKTFLSQLFAKKLLISRAGGRQPTPKCAIGDAGDLGDGRRESSRPGDHSGNIVHSGCDFGNSRDDRRGLAEDIIRLGPGGRLCCNREHFLCSRTEKYLLFGGKAKAKTMER